MRCNLNLNTVTLWAMWYTKYGPTTMQGWKGCDQLQTNQTITLTDARDNNQYTVAKLLDGRCWMTQNLRITDITIDNSDSDISQSQFIIPKSSNTSVVVGSNDHDRNDMYLDEQYGGYYSFYVASAGTGTSSFTSGEVKASICSSGWRLPSLDEYQTLINTYSSSAFFSSPMNFAYSGWKYRLGAFSYVNSDCRYWTSTGVDNWRTRSFCCAGPSMHPGDDRSYDFNIRCLTEA